MVLSVIKYTSKLHCRLKSYDNFAEKNEFVLLDKVVKLVGGGSVT